MYQQSQYLVLLFGSHPGICTLFSASLLSVKECSFFFICIAERLSFIWEQGCFGMLLKGLNITIKLQLNHVILWPVSIKSQPRTVKKRLQVERLAAHRSCLKYFKFFQLWARNSRVSFLPHSTHACRHFWH